MGRMENSETTPVTGIVVQSYSGGVQGAPADRVIVVDSEETDDYLPACVATALLGPFGMCGTALLCPSNHGFMGMSVGCGYFNIWRGLVLVSAFLLAYFGLINCDAGLIPTDFSFTDCQDLNGTWAPAPNATTVDGVVPMGCFNACPRGLHLVHADEPWYNFTEYCEDIDPTCTGLSRWSFMLNLLSCILFGSVALHFAMTFAKRIEASRQQAVRV